MRRWNGWGDEAVELPVSATAVRFLEQHAGAGRPLPGGDATLEQVLAAIPRSRLAPHRLISTDAAERLRHARGQSLDDWLALRGGELGAAPDGVAWPADEQEVRELLQHAADAGAAVIPYGGGTSVVGHINPLPQAGGRQGVRPVLTIDMARIGGLNGFDEASGLAAFGAGVSGPELEAQLRPLGFTLGHYPQSFEYSTLGGWVVTRSSGQQSMGYGRIERLFAGGRLVAPAGTLVIPAYPASAAGPDLREVVLGSEGRLGILTEATVRASRLPQVDAVHAVFLPGWEQTLECVREIAQAHLPLAMLRASTAAETAANLALAGRENLIALLEQLLALRRIGAEKCMLLIGLCGNASAARAGRREALAIAARHGGVHVGQAFGREWQRTRFVTPYLRNTFWSLGYAVDTLETACPWPAVAEMVAAIEASLRQAGAARDVQVYAFSHLSSIYPTGSSIYTTYMFPLADGSDRIACAEETRRCWHAMKSAASRALVALGGTISHQHGVGIDHAPYFASEKGVLGAAAIRALFAAFDPAGIMNPGKMVT